MVIYAVTIFLSAFLLFQVQPLIAKIILPWFGGSAAVWSAALLFFQLVLLVGYGYAHCSIRFLKPRTQMIVHIALLAVSCVLLPIMPSERWKPIEAGDPTVRILVLLAATIGLPYFLLSSTSPLLQAWYVRRSGSSMPYRLFALSNFGSLLALVSFPFVVEPALTSHQQVYLWSAGYVAFILLCAFAGLVSRREASVSIQPSPAGPAPEDQGAPAAKPKFTDLFLWVTLAACASTLLVAITNHLSANVAPIPFLWVVPLALYLATFMLAFESDRIYNRAVCLILMAPMLGWMARGIFEDSGNLHIRIMIPVYSGGLFICCMFCHGELARRRPAPQYLTLFYLMVSLGGALGGLFVAIIAPHVFHSFAELPIGLSACGLLALILMWNWVEYGPAKWALRVGLAVAAGCLVGYLAREYRSNEGGYRLVVRNFYGVLHVRDALATSADEYSERTLLHGTITHGSQILDQDMRYTTTSYYGPDSGVGRAIRAFQEKGPVRVGVVGLGAGVLSNYGRAGDYFRIYEINPLVEKIAQTEFTFFPHSAADKRILMGDARLTMERQESQQFDVLAVDAFSSDAIPIHLLTREALAVYFRQLKPDGVLALHISNRYLDLEPVCAKGAQFFGKQAMTVTDDEEENSYLSGSTWVLLTAAPDIFKSAAFDHAVMTKTTAPQKFRPWTDDYSNIFQIVRLR